MDLDALNAMLQAYKGKGKSIPGLGKGKEEQNPAKGVIIVEVPTIGGEIVLKERANLVENMAKAILQVAKEVNRP